MRERERERERERGGCRIGQLVREGDIKQIYLKMSKWILLVFSRFFSPAKLKADMHELFGFCLYQLCIIILITLFSISEKPSIKLLLLNSEWNKYKKKMLVHISKTVGP